MVEAIAEVIEELKSLARSQHKKGFSYYKIDDTNALGVRMPDIHSLSKKLKNEHDLAMALWEETCHEAKILATLVADPGKLTIKQADKWVKDFYSWDLCDQAATNLFRKTEFIWDSIFKWFEWEGEYQRRAGFTNLAVLAVHHKKVDDACFLRTFPAIEKYAGDNRNFVKKAINWAIREMGKRRIGLHQPCKELCYRLVEQESPSAKWIARDALRELNSEKTQSRLNKMS